MRASRGQATAKAVAALLSFSALVALVPTGQLPLVAADAPSQAGRVPNAVDRLAGAASAGAVLPLVPARLLDSRVGSVTVDHLFEGVGRVAAGSVTEVQVVDRGGVGAAASAVVLNVTAVGPSEAGFLTVFPCGGERPLASNVNYVAGQVVPNAVVAQVGAGGRVCVFSKAETDLVVDVNGWFEAGGVSPLVPARLLDSRVGSVTVDHLFEGVGRVAAGSVTEVQVVDRGGVGAAASAVVLNVTAVGPSEAGFLTVFPCGGERPLASNVNYVAGQVVPNAVVAQVGAGGRVCVFSKAETDLVVDVNAWFGDPDAPQPSADTVALPSTDAEVGDVESDGTRIVTTSLAGTATVGGFVVMEQADGAYYGRVLSAEGTKVITQPATLADIFPDLDFQYIADLAHAPNLQTQSVELGDNLEIDCTDNTGAKASVSVTPVIELGRFEADLDWSLAGGLSRMRMVYAPRVALTVESDLVGAFECALEYDLDEFDIELPKIRFSIGVVPVVITQDLDAELRIALSAEAKVTTTVGISGGLSLGVDCIDGSCALVRDSFLVTGGDQQFGVEGSLEAQLLIEYSAKAYGLIGLEGELKPYVGLEYEPDEGKFPALEAGVKAALDFVVELHSWLRYEEQLAELNVFGPVVLWSRLEVPDAPTSLLAGLPANAQLKAYGGTGPYTFTATRLPPGVSLSASGMLTGTAPAAGAYDLQFTVHDSSGQSRAKSFRVTVNPVTPEISARFGRIVELPDGRAWYVDKRGARHHIPDGGTYQCLAAQGIQVVHAALESDLQWYADLEQAQCVRADIGDIVRISGDRSYRVSEGWTARSIRDGGSFMCLDVNGADVHDVPVYWVFDLGFGADYSWSCWNAAAAPGKVVRASNGASYYIDLRSNRHHIPNGGTYDCIVAQGKPDYGNVVPIEWVDDLAAQEGAQCVRADIGDIARISGDRSYLIAEGWKARSISDGGTFMCLDVNGADVVDVPVYWVYDLGFGANYAWSCWNSTTARGRSVRASDGTAWYVDLRGGRHWMPNGGTYDCIVAQGKAEYGNVVPIEWVDDLTQYEHAACVRANPGDVIRHVDNDSYLILPNWTRAWVSNGGTYNCLSGAGRSIVQNVPRYYIDDLAKGPDLTFCPADRILKVGSVTWYVGNDLVRHPIPNGGTYLCLTAWKGKQVVEVTQTQANMFTVGSNQTCTASEAYDQIITAGGTSWYVDTGGTKHHVPNNEVYFCLTAWNGKSVRNVSQDQADAIPTGAAQGCSVTHLNDRVIRASGQSWYVDGAGVRHWIPNGGTFLCMTTWQGKSVVDISTQQAYAFPETHQQSCSASAAANRVIRMSNGASWYVDTNLVRHYIPNGGTYNCAVHVRGVPVINNVSQGHVDAIASGADYRCRAIVIGPGNWRYYIDASGQRFLIPGETSQDPYRCLASKSYIRTFADWNVINMFPENATRAGCHFD